MSLQGTLDTFTLDEVAELVERTAKTGALSARDGRFTGTIWFTAGGLCAAEAGGASGPCGSSEELQVRLVDVCFELFALRAGYFEFVPGEAAPWEAGEVVTLGTIAERVASVAGDEWEAVIASVPSFDHRPALAGDLEDDSVTLTLDRNSWRLMAQMDGHRDVRTIGRNLGVSALEVARTLHGLVEAGAVELLPPEEGDVVPLPLPATAGRDQSVGDLSVGNKPRPGSGTHPSEVLDSEGLAAVRRALEQAALGIDRDAGGGPNAGGDDEPPYYDDAGRLLDAALVGGEDKEIDVRRFGHATVGGALEEAYAESDAALAASADIEIDEVDDDEVDEVRPPEAAGDRASLLRMFSSLNNKR